jgi:streptogramin lyase
MSRLRSSKSLAGTPWRSDQGWLTIGCVADGVVHFSFAQHTGPSRTARLTVIGRQLVVTQAGPATQFSVTPSVPSEVAGMAFGITITAEGATGHPAAYLGLVHFSSSDPQATLPADDTFTAGDHGTHTFSGIVFGTAGSQTLTASNGGIGSVTEFSVLTPNSAPAGITAGVDGNLWFIEAGGNVGKITSAGTVTEYPIPTASSAPEFITAGPDGNLWFTEAGGNKVGKITSAGTITEFPVPTGGSVPEGITAGRDGNLWFVDEVGNKVGRITPAGALTEYTIPTATAYPREITAGSDGSLWFTEIRGNKVGRITPAGAVTEYPIPTADSSPYEITAGPDGNLWFTENSGNRVGRLTSATLTGSATVNVVAAAAAQFVVATTAANADVAGTPFDVTVRALDPYGNFATGYTGTVHFTSTDPQASLPADYTFTAADNGVHTFSA